MSYSRATRLIPRPWRTYCAFAFLLSSVVSAGSCQRNNSPTMAKTHPAAVDSTNRDRKVPVSMAAANRHSILLPTVKSVTRETTVKAMNETAASRNADTGSRHPSTMSAGPPATDPGNATAIYRNARSAQQKAHIAAEHGQLPNAYTESLQAWESLQDLSDDSDCKTLSAELLKELESYGEKLSTKQSGLPPRSLDKPVRFE